MLNVDYMLVDKVETCISIKIFKTRTWIAFFCVLSHRLGQFVYWGDVKTGQGSDIKLACEKLTFQLHTDWQCKVELREHLYIPLLCLLLKVFALSPETNKAHAAH